VAFYLKVIQAAGTDDADTVFAQMREMKINDFMTQNGWLREDGRVMRDMYLEEVKSPAESSRFWRPFQRKKHSGRSRMGTARWCCADWFLDRLVYARTQYRTP
jgi:hypothetical protein